MLKIGDRVKIAINGTISKTTYVIAEIYKSKVSVRGSRYEYGLNTLDGGGIMGSYKESELILMNGVRQAILRISEMKIKHKTELQLRKRKKKRAKTKKKRYNTKKE